MSSNEQTLLRRLKIFAHTIMGWDVKIINHERYILEQKIIPYFAAQKKPLKVLFVGCGSYTKHYQRWFKQHEYWTIDLNPLKRIYGAKNHITDSMSNLNLYFQPNELDLIICNGVFGWGLNEKQDVEDAFAGCFECLNEDGVLIIGWDDIPENKPFPLETCQSINKFKPYLFPPLATSLYTNLSDEADQHKYNFYTKPASVPVRF